MPGVWGPYLGAVLPGLWLEEAGQSATGALLDHIVALHAASAALEGNPHAAAGGAHRRAARGRGRGVRARPARAARLPRQPLAAGRPACDRRDQRPDPRQLARCAGRLYYRTAVAIALGTRHILDALNAKGWRIDTLHVTGGHTKNPLLMELYADATGCRVVEPAEDAVLLGTAMTAAVAAGLQPSLAAAAAAMAAAPARAQPDPARRAGFDRDYRVFLLMHEQRRALERL